MSEERRVCECSQCREGCGLEHPLYWKPKMTARINGVIVRGDDPSDCMAHYLLQAGYPTDRPDHLRKVAGSLVGKPGKVH